MRPIDQTDRQLLALLKHNARASITELAATLEVSRVTVKSRMAALRADGVIRRFTIDVSDVADQDTIQAVSMLELQLSKVEKVHRALARFPEITSIQPRVSVKPWMFAFAWLTGASFGKARFPRSETSNPSPSKASPKPAVR